MAHGLDRLERIFGSKRKGSAVSTESSSSLSTAPCSPATPSMEMAFPSPSFIRPKATRMTAREELCLKHSMNVSSSAIDSLSPKRKASTPTYSSHSTSVSRRQSPAPARSSTHTSDPDQQMLSVFRGFSFPKPPSRSENASPAWPSCGLKPLPQLPTDDVSPATSPGIVSSSLGGIETPPLINLEDEFLYRRMSQSQEPADSLHEDLPTPDMSTGIGPLADWQVPGSRPIAILDENLYNDIQRQLDRTIGQLPSSNASSSFSSTSSVASTYVSSSGTSLQEPDLTDFLNLSDYNVAEYEDETSSDSAEGSPRDSVTIAPSVSSLPLSEPPLLTLSPPCASRPAMVAAFEAARIASRYGFDMMYVVNLWPDTCDPLSRGFAAEQHYSDSTIKSFGGMAGRLLAAYGLHHTPFPFQISADVHVKILRTTGWLEYRDNEARSCDFARAYACAFYPGQYQRNLKAGSGRASSREADRGIVFAAYRKPRADGSIQYSSAEELIHLRRDVEVLVEMLIDIHVASKHSLTRKSYSDETGPMPVPK